MVKGRVPKPKVMDDSTKGEDDTKGLVPKKVTKKRAVAKRVIQPGSGLDHDDTGEIIDLPPNSRHESRRSAMIQLVQAKFNFLEAQDLAINSANSVDEEEERKSSLKERENEHTRLLLQFTNAAARGPTEGQDVSDYADLEAEMEALREERNIAQEERIAAILVEDRRKEDKFERMIQRKQRALEQMFNPVVIQAQGNAQPVGKGKISVKQPRKSKVQLVTNMQVEAPEEIEEEEEEDYVGEEDDEEVPSEPQDQANQEANKKAAQKLLQASRLPKKSTFGSGAVGSGYDFILEHEELEVPNDQFEVALLLDRIEVSRLLPNMLVPVLAFRGQTISFYELRKELAALYSVLPGGQEGRTNLMLVYTNNSYAQWEEYPQCLSFDTKVEERDGYSVLVMSDICIQSRMLSPEIQTALMSAGILNPIAPTTTSNNKSDYHMLSNGTMVKVDKVWGKHAGEWLPVRRALHGDPSLVAAFMAGESDMRLSSTKLMTRIRNSSKLTPAQQKLPIFQGNMLVSFMAFNWCKQINWSGSGASRTADACHLSHFMPAHETGQPGVLALHTFRTSSEIVKALDNLKAVCMDTFQEKYRGPRPFFTDIFKDVKDQFEDEDPDVDIQHISIDYQVYNFQAQLVNWANLFTSEENEHMKIAEFRAKCLSALEIDTSKWRRDRSEADTSKIPRQIVNPPGTKLSPVDPVRPAAVSKFTRGEKRDYKAHIQGQRQEAEQQQLKAANYGGRGGGRGGGYGGRGGYPKAPQNTPQPQIKVEPGTARGICVRDLLTNADGAIFPQGCVKPAGTCQHRHNVQLTAAGKLSPADKAEVLRSLGTVMKGKFAESAKQYVILHL